MDIINKFMLTIKDHNGDILSRKKYKNLVMMSKDSGIKYSVLRQLLLHNRNKSEIKYNSSTNRLVNFVIVENI